MHKQDQEKLFPFTITIDDEYSAFRYKMKFPYNVSIYDIVKALGEKFEIEIPETGEYIGETRW